MQRETWLSAHIRYKPLHKGIAAKMVPRLLGQADVNATYNLYIHLYVDGFDEMYDALAGNG